jgi:hypothetical protein
VFHSAGALGAGISVCTAGALEAGVCQCMHRHGSWRWRVSVFHTAGAVGAGVCQCFTGDNLVLNLVLRPYFFDTKFSTGIIHGTNYYSCIRIRILVRENRVSMILEYCMFGTTHSQLLKIIMICEFCKKIH